MQHAVQYSCFQQLDDPVGMKHTNLIEQPTDSMKPEDAYTVTLIKAQEIKKKKANNTYFNT